MTLKNSLWLLLLSMGLSLSFVSCSDDDDGAADLQTIAEIAAGDDQFSTLVNALDRAGLVATLEGDGPFTVFAPTNDAFTSLGIDLNTLSDAELTEILLYHVLGGEVMSGDLSEGQTYATTAATTGPGNTQLSMLIEKSGSSVTVNGSVDVSSADLIASNGVIHVVDAVILPLDIVGHATVNDNFSELVGALSAASGGLVGVLESEGPFTVFAPVNDAFEEIASVVATLNADQLADVLTYHVVGSANVRSTDLSNGLMVETVNSASFTVNLGQTVTITDEQGNTATVVLTDVQATNGVIHVLDKVILPNL